MCVWWRKMIVLSRWESVEEGAGPTLLMIVLSLIIVLLFGALVSPFAVPCELTNLRAAGCNHWDTVSTPTCQFRLVADWEPAQGSWEISKSPSKKEQIKLKYLTVCTLVKMLLRFFTSTVFCTITIGTLYFNECTPSSWVSGCMFICTHWSYYIEKVPNVCWLHGSMLKQELRADYSY